MSPPKDTVAMTILESYSGMVFAQGFLPDGQSVVEQMGGLFVFVLIPATVRGSEMSEEDSCKKAGNMNTNM